MASFYYNSDSGESAESQWTRHIQNNAYVIDISKSINNSTRQQTKDISAFVTNQAREINNTIQNASIEQIAAVQQSTSAICGTLDSGFNLLSDNLLDISFSLDDLRSEVSAMASMLDWKLSLLIEQQKISNLLLGNISILLRIPDIQKERQYHIEQGIKFLKNSIYDNDFYEDSLTNLLKAEKIEPTDYFALHRIGLIYMYSPKHLALNKAEDYFKKAAKYAVAESNAGASVTNNFLAGDVNQNLSEQMPSIDSIKLQAAESYLFAGRSCYIQGKLDDAVDFAGKGFNLVPQLVEAGFTQAKALAANNKETQAAIVLEKVINIDRFYSLKTLSDLDLCPKQSIQSLLKKLQLEATENARDILKNCKELIIQNSNAADFLEKIERLVNKNSYLTSKKAIDLFDKVKEWHFCEPYKNPIQTNYLKEIIKLIETLNTLQFYKEDNSMKLINPDFIKKFIETINQKTQWNFPVSFFNSNQNWETSIVSKSGEYSTVQFIKIEKTFNDDLPEIIANRRNLLQLFINDNVQHLNYLETKRKKVDADNYADSVGAGILGVLGGGITGFIVGFFVVLLISIGSCIKTGKFGYNSESTFLITSIIGGVIGFIISFNNKRKKNNK